MRLNHDTQRFGVGFPDAVTRYDYAYTYNVSNRVHFKSILCFGDTPVFLYAINEKKRFILKLEVTTLGNYILSVLACFFKIFQLLGGQFVFVDITNGITSGTQGSYIDMLFFFDFFCVYARSYLQTFRFQLPMGYRDCPHLLPRHSIL